MLSPYTYESIALPFNFEYAGQKQTYCFLLNSGSLLFGGTFERSNLSINFYKTNSAAQGILAPLQAYGNMNVSSENSTIKRKYLLSGTAPFRTFTIEWEKILWSDSYPLNTASEVSFRIVLEESTNNIRFIYGPNNSIEDGQSANIGLNRAFADQISFMSITPESPATVSTITSNDDLSVADYPGEGVEYTFTYQQPNCKIPSGLSEDASTITSSSVVLGWSNSGSETSWDILVKNLNDDSSQVVSANSNPFTLTDLEQDMNYSVSIRANCGTSNSDYSPQRYFTTLESCPALRNVSSNNITIASADFTWDLGDNETSWEAIVVLANDPEPSAGDITTTQSYSASALTKDTDYKLYVRSNCDANGFSKWIKYSFQTLPTCNIPTSVSVTNETCSSGTLSWTSNDSETLWEILVVEIATDEETIYDANTNPFTIDNLKSNRTYRVRVRAVCAADDVSRYSIFNFITTTPDTTNPIANCVAPFSIQLDETGNASITAEDINNNSTDDCTIQSITIDKDTFTSADIGDQTVTLTIRDTGYNVSTCSTTVTVEENTLSTDEVAIKPILFYPNPVKDKISFTQAPSSINLYDISGKLIYKSKNSKKQYDLSSFTRGIYFIEIENTSGNKTIQKLTKY